MKNQIFKIINEESDYQISNEIIKYYDLLEEHKEKKTYLPKNKKKKKTLDRLLIEIEAKTREKEEDKINRINYEYFQTENSENDEVFEEKNNKTNLILPGNEYLINKKILNNFCG